MPPHAPATHPRRQALTPAFARRRDLLYGPRKVSPRLRARPSSAWAYCLSSRLAACQVPSWSASFRVLSLACSQNYVSGLPGRVSAQRPCANDHATVDPSLPILQFTCCAQSASPPPPGFSPSSRSICSARTARRARRWPDIRSRRLRRRALLSGTAGETHRAQQRPPRATTRMTASTSERWACERDRPAGSSAPTLLARVGAELPKAQRRSTHIFFRKNKRGKAWRWV